MDASPETTAALIEQLPAVNKAGNGFVWGPVMLAALVGTGIYVSIRTRFIQFTRFCLMCRVTMAFPAQKRTARWR